MAQHFVAALWLASCQASVLIVLVFAAQLLFGRRLAPRWRHALWLLVVARLALPWSLHVPLAHPAPVTIPTVLEIMAAPPSQPVPVPVGPTITSPASAPLPWWLLAWAFGALALASWLALAQWKLTRRITRLRPVVREDVLNLLEDAKETLRARTPVTLIETDCVGSPSLFGFVRPRLLLPKGLTARFSGAELRFIFLHELAHVKRRDILTGWLAALLQILHWFNPLVWLAFQRLRKERELASDALALSHAASGEHRAYGHAIMRLLEDFGRSSWAPSMAGALENIRDLKERMTQIAGFDRLRPRPALAIMLCGLLGAAAFTSCRKEETPKAGPPPLAGAQSNSPAEAPKTAAPPRIVSASPPFGASDIDPDKTTQISVTFDQDMGDGMSWVGGGPAYPKIPDGTAAHWIDKRTCVLPVKLYAAHFYELGLNSSSFQNFQSEAGLPVEPVTLRFTTKGASESLKMRLRLPLVVSMNPPNGARGVDPKTSELRVTFDVPMDGGMSWCGDPAKQAQNPAGKSPSWTPDRKTCVLPVTLQPGMRYEYFLNSPSYRNFRAAQGQPLEPVSYSFETAK